MCMVCFKNWKEVNKLGDQDEYSYKNPNKEARLELSRILQAML